jgi:hypothetical protein
MEHNNKGNNHPTRKLEREGKFNDGMPDSEKTNVQV